MKRVIIGISGASGAVFGIRALQVLASLSDVESHLILSPGAARTLAEETDWTPDAVRKLADVCHAHGDVGAPLSSGSFRAHGMLIAPCSGSNGPGRRRLSEGASPHGADGARDSAACGAH
jgi:4-hydroxy-3-polyprenylbenzoate decarboxylase